MTIQEDILDITALSVGFDLRLHEDIVVDIPPSTTSARYDGPDGEIGQVTGGLSAVVCALVDAGYRVQVGEED